MNSNNNHKIIRFYIVWLLLFVLIISLKLEINLNVNSESNKQESLFQNLYFAFMLECLS